MAAKIKKPAPAGANGELDNLAATGGESFTGYEALADLGRGNLAAALRANAVFAEGMEAIGQEVMAYARNSLETVAEAATALLAAKTLEDVVQLHSDFAKASFDRMMASSTKLSEMGVKVADEALGPIGDRVEATFRKLGKPLAA